MVTSCVPVSTQVAHPCQRPVGNDEQLLLVAEAKQQLQTYLQAKAITANVEAKEEGAFMLGAYPRAQVLWSIRISQPPLTTADTNIMDDITLAAYCLRSGWVWLNITDPSGDTTMVSYAQADLEELYRQKGYP